MFHKHFFFKQFKIGYSHKVTVCIICQHLNVSPWFYMYVVFIYLFVLNYFMKNNLIINIL